MTAFERLMALAAGWALLGTYEATGEWPFSVGALLVFLLALVEIFRWEKIT